MLVNGELSKSRLMNDKLSKSRILPACPACPSQGCLSMATCPRILCPRILCPRILCPRILCAGQGQLCKAKLLSKASQVCLSECTLSKSRPVVQGKVACQWLLVQV